MIDDLMKLLDALSGRDIKQELAESRAIIEWAYKQVGFEEGDRARISKHFHMVETLEDAVNSWWPYRECLIAGALCTVARIHFSTYTKGWFMHVELDEEWSISTGSSKPCRYWNGPVARTPEGMVPPSKFDQENYPDGRKHTFALRLKDLEAV